MQLLGQAAWRRSACYCPAFLRLAFWAQQEGQPPTAAACASLPAETAARDRLGKSSAEVEVKPLSSILDKLKERQQAAIERQGARRWGRGGRRGWQGTQRGRPALSPGCMLSPCASASLPRRRWHRAAKPNLTAAPSFEEIFAAEAARPAAGEGAAEGGEEEEDDGLEIVSEGEEDGEGGGGGAHIVELPGSSAKKARRSDFSQVRLPARGAEREGARRPSCC